jgi:hypothetical protein
MGGKLTYRLTIFKLKDVLDERKSDRNSGFAMGANDHRAMLFSGQLLARGFCRPLFHRRRQSNPSTALIFAKPALPTMKLVLRFFPVERFCFGTSGIYHNFCCLLRRASEYSALRSTQTVDAACATAKLPAGTRGAA